jgi:signal transduction histidine kinase
METINCWEMKKCGREPGGERVHELGICPAATEQRVDGVNGGRNGGRTCWAIAGTLCGGKVQGTYAAKITSCHACEFYRKVQQDILESDSSRPEQGSRVLSMVLERTVTLEREIEQRQKVEDALRQVNAKLNLLSSVTRHDMLNKLGSIGLLMELLEQKYPGDTGAQEYMKKIRDQLQNLEEMVWFTSDYQDLGVQEPTWQHIPEVIAGIREWVQAVPVELDPGLAGYEVFADPLLPKVFYNLADNAIRHGERVNRIRIRAEEGPEGLAIICEDDGVGVPVSEKEKIFSKGYGKHTGLGLFLVREILSITGIAIRETGDYGKGARFEMVVPEGSFRKKR